MRCRLAAQVVPWRNGTCLYRSHAPGAVRGAVCITRNYTAPPALPPAPGEGHEKLVILKERSLAVLQKATDLGRQWGQKSMTTASATANNWWGRYEEFVGLNEIKDAQSSVTEAEKSFMVARGMVREAHISLEAMQVRLKEVRDRLDRVSREEAHYLELATQEHRLLQEERRLRTTYETAEGAEREKFALFSAGVRESHEKERTRAERTKNWSVIGSVLGALIGVMGSTYVNRVRLQELKVLLLEAQKGPVSLQEAIQVQAGMHRSQQEELRGLIDSLRVALKDGVQRGGDAKPVPVPAPSPVPTPVPIPQVTTPPPPSASDAVLKEILDLVQRGQVLMEGFQPQLGVIEQNIGKVESELLAVKSLVETLPVPEKPVVIAPQDSQMFVCDTESVMRGLDQTEKRLEVQIGKTSLYNTVLAYTALALTVPALYIFFKGTGT